MREGGVNIEPEKAFSGKYKLCKLLGAGLNGKVYLVRHKTLGVFRAMKAVPLNNKTCCEEFKKEAMLLKELRHPGIPIIYDMEEAEDYLYIIEEYIKGETLYERVHNTGILSKGEIIKLGINLCDPVIYLHSQSKPILHLDIHPGNLIIHDNNVSLIDFDHARYSFKKMNFSDGYGNKYFAAPEQWTKAQVSCETDIYAIGAIMYYAGTAYFPNEKLDLPMSWGKELNSLISACLYEDKNLRIDSVETLKKELEAIFDKCKNTSSRKIAVAASVKGAGATYIALGLTAFLRENGVAAIYEECNDSGHMNVLLQTYVRECDEYGAFKLNKIFIKPRNGHENAYSKHSASIYVRDYGTDMEKMLEDEADLNVLVCGGNIWQQEQNKKAIEKISRLKNSKILYNLCSDQMEFFISGQIDRKNYFVFPFLANIMESRKDRNDIFKAMLKSDVNFVKEKKNLIKCIKEIKYLQ